MSDPKERGIVYTAEMVRAILEKKKSQTRRVVKVPPFLQERFYDLHGKDFFAGEEWELVPCLKGGWWPKSRKTGVLLAGLDEYGGVGFPCPYGEAGDSLYGRETYRVLEWTHTNENFYALDVRVEYRDEQTYVWRLNDSSQRHYWDAAKRAAEHGRWIAGRYMPRWASRFTHQLLSVRAEPVQEITPTDIYAEGVRHAHYSPGSVGSDFSVRNVLFPELWDSINGKRAPWNQNPYVWRLALAPLVM